MKTCRRMPNHRGRVMLWMGALWGVLPGGLAIATDGPGVFFFDANLFEIQTGQRGDEFELRFQYPFTRTGFALVSPVAGDWDGDGLDSIGVFDHLAKRFHLRNENTAGDDDFVIDYAVFGDALLPVAGDWNDNGTDTIGVFVRNQARFLLRNSNSSGGPQIDFFFGVENSLPVAGDWDGDGDDTVGVYTPADAKFRLRNANSSGQADIVVSFGPLGAQPVVGDWDGDGVDTIGVFDPATSEFLLRNSNTPGAPDVTIPVRAARWVWTPIVGHWRIPTQIPREPGFAWAESTPQAVDIDPQQLAAAYDGARTIESLYSLLVIRHGKLVAEEYFGGFERSIGGNIKSVSKSILSALVGIAIRNGRFSSVDQTVASVMPELFENQRDRRKLDITIEQMMTMTTGLGWNEPNLWPWYLSGHPNQFVIDQAIWRDPGTAFLYNTGLTHLMAAMLKRASGVETPILAETQLFRPLGISVQRWDVDLRGAAVGGAEVYTTPRDMARFGYLYLRCGTIDGVEIVPRDWVAYTTSELVPPAWVPGHYGYGAWWWRQRFDSHDVYFAWGYGGQFIFVVPELDLIVVATSDWTVSWQQAGTQGRAVFDLLAEWILPAVQPDSSVGLGELP